MTWEIAIMIIGGLGVCVFPTALFIGWRRHERRAKKERRDAFMNALLRLDAIASRTLDRADRLDAQALSGSLAALYDLEAGK